MNIAKPIQSLVLLLCVSISNTVFAQQDVEQKVNNAMFTGTDTDAAQVVVQFHKALETEDKISVKRLLAKDVLVLEDQGIERSADEYAKEHMLADMAYLQAVEVKILEHHVQEFSSVAISIARSSEKGIYNYKIIDREGNETITLIKTIDGWKIAHIHWSN